MGTRLGQLNIARPTQIEPSRRSLALTLLALPVAARAHLAGCATPRVLFVCPAGTVKSAIAREALRKRASAAGIAVQVSSRGLHPEDHVSPGLAQNLRADGLDPASEPARPLTDADVRSADIVIAFDEAAQAPDLRDARAWDIPSWNNDYAGAKAALASKLDSLIAELRAGADRCGKTDR